MYRVLTVLYYRVLSKRTTTAETVMKLDSNFKPSQNLCSLIKRTEHSNGFAFVDECFQSSYLLFFDSVAATVNKCFLGTKKRRLTNISLEKFEFLQMTARDFRFRGSLLFPGRESCIKLDNKLSQLKKI